VSSDRPSAFGAAQRVASAVLVSFLLLPVAALLFTLRWDDFVVGLRNPLLFPALRLSLLTTSCSLGLVVGLGSLLAWRIARHPGRASRWMEAITQLPAVIPPAVAGVAALSWFPYMLAFPVELLTGAAQGPAVVRGFAGQLVWLGVWIAAYHVTWTRGLRRYGAVGG